MKKLITTTILFIMYAAVLYIGFENPIIGEPDMNNWIMDVTVITDGQTYHAIVYNIDHSGTITHIETIITGTITQYYTLTFTKTLTKSTTTTLTQVTPTTTTTTVTTTTTINTTTTTTTLLTTTTTFSTETAPVTVVPPTQNTNSIITMTSKVIAFNWRSIVVWASIVYTDKTVVGYTTVFYK